MGRIYSNILKSLVFPAADRVMKTKLIYYYHRIKKMQSWDADEIESWQNENLRKLIIYAYNNTVYYKELFDNLGLLPETIITKDDLNKIPVLTRQLVIENFDKLISEKINNIRYNTSSTGGTTATPMTYLLDTDSWSYSNADYMVNWEKTGYFYGDKHLAFGGSSLFGGNPKSIKHKIYYTLKGRIKLDGMYLSDDVLKKFADVIVKKKIKFVYGYASSIYLLAKYCMKNKISIQLMACFTTAEILTDTYRNTISEAFQCKILNCYGAHDGGITAFEHNKNNFEVGYNVIMRVEGRENGNGSKGPILLTNLLNYAMPMINYQLGDEVKIKEDVTDYNGQVIEEVYGRTSDVITLDNGNILTGFNFQPAIFDLPVQAWNLEKIDGNTLLCKVIKKDSFKASDEDIIISKLKEYAGAEVKIVVAYYDRFELTPSGKRNYFLNV